MRWTFAVRLAVLVAVTGCSSAAPSAGSTAAVTTPAAPASAAPPATTVAPASTSIAEPVPVATTAMTLTTAPAATTMATTTTSTTSPAPQDVARTIGTSVEGRPITAIHRGGRTDQPVVVIGVIHGDEDAGLAITDRLAGPALDVPDGIDLWIIPAMNPDGVANEDRHNAAQVDLNRNFPHQWGPIGTPGDPQYAGTGPASEPETQAVVTFFDEIRPALVIWYHQDLDRIAPGTGRDGRIRARYAELTGVPLLRITGGTYTGVAATWARNTLPDSVAFIVELGPTLGDAQADTHAAAVLTVAREL